MNEERLLNELERINRRLAREQQSEEHKEAAAKRQKIAKLRSRLNFLQTQTPKSLQGSIESAENKQLLLQSQIAKLQEWVRFYNDLILSRDTQITKVKAELDQLDGRLPPAPPVEDTLERVQKQWEYLQGLMTK